MSLDSVDKWRLYEAGFTEREIRELDAAVDPSGKPQPPIKLDSPAWKATVANRQSFTNQIRQLYFVSHNKTISRQLYERIINQWYAQGITKTPFDWLKLVYRPRKRADFQVALQNRLRLQQLMLKRQFIRRRAR